MEPTRESAKFGGTDKERRASYERDDEESKEVEDISQIKVGEPCWVGSITGYRTYQVTSTIGSEQYNVIRRYSNFESLRYKLVSACPQ